MSVKFTRTEWHQVAKEYQYDVDDDILIEEFGSVERFKEVLSHQELAHRGYCHNAVGEEPNEDEQEKFDNLFWDGIVDYDDVDEDWWTDRKGGYDVTFDLAEDELLEGMEY
jgi:hypothetical protein